ncbi:unnamed protein product [Didymodactylos carnosus]|nr:unnamed protein product [Didymodactylos carnosus]CAF4324336.1 unnamed protein product [Didymodactylos carnosus]
MMQDYHITHIINVSTTGPKAPSIVDESDEHFLRIPINDSLNAQLTPYFDQAYNFIEKARLSNGRVFIHSGISRSPALAVAYIMKHMGLTADDAYKFIKAKRHHISPNFNFLGQLSEYEHQCRKQQFSSTSTVEFPQLMKCVSSNIIDRRRFVQLEGHSSSSTDHPSLKRERDLDDDDNILINSAIVTTTTGNEDVICRPKHVVRPKGFNFDLTKQHSSTVSLISPSTAIANLSVDSPASRTLTNTSVDSPSSLPLPLMFNRPTLLRPNSITLKRLSPTTDTTLVNSDLDRSPIIKRVKTNDLSHSCDNLTSQLPIATLQSPLTEKNSNDLINTFSQAQTESNLRRSGSLQSLDSFEKGNESGPCSCKLDHEISKSDSGTLLTSNNSKNSSVRTSRELLVS